MTKFEQEFKKLTKRLDDAWEYEKIRYASDTPENQEVAIKTCCQIIKHMEEVWKQLNEDEKERNTDFIRSVDR